MGLNKVTIISIQRFSKIEKRTGFATKTDVPGSTI